MASPSPQPSPLKGEGEIKFLDLADGRRLAYAFSEGTSPGVVFLSGFRSDMTGTKAVALEALCKQRGQRYLRFDYSGHGQSSGDFKDGTIGAWKRDALDMIDHLMPGEIILAGSSMGGWLALLAALERKERVRALVGIAAAPDFTEKLMWDAFTPEQKNQMTQAGEVLIPDCYGSEPYAITRALIEEGRNHLLLDAPIELEIKVRLIQGLQDEDVPWNMAVTLMKQLSSKDCALQLIKDGGHRLSEPAQIEAICRTVAELL